MMQSPKGYEVGTLFSLLFPTIIQSASKDGGYEIWMRREAQPQEIWKKRKSLCSWSPGNWAEGGILRSLPDHGAGYPSRRNGSILTTALNIFLGMSHPPSHMPDMIQEHSEALHCFFIPRSGSWPQPRMEMMSGLDLALTAKAFVNLILEASLRRADAKL